MRFRSRIVLLAASGTGTREIGRRVGCTTGTVSKWRVRYARDRLAGLDETGNRGAEPKYGPDDRKRILAMLDRPPPAGHANWTAPLLSRALGDVHEQYIWRFLRAQKIDLSRRKSWCRSNDPEFTAKAAEIVGLYMAPPDNAVVLSIDEKPSIQALERAQGYLKFPDGRALTGQSHDDKRHGTTTLFAALDVGTGEVRGSHYQRRRRVEFLDFMNDTVAAYPDHYTPTRASWLNQIEIWFSILAGQSLSGASFRGVDELVGHIDSFIATYNENARPYVWTKSQVHQKRLEPCFADQ